MKTQFKKIRTIRKKIKKVLRFLLVLIIAFFIFKEIYPYCPRVKKYFERFIYVDVNATEVNTYYDLLSKHAQPAKELILNLGLSDKDNLQVAIDRLKGAMGSGDCVIRLAHHDAQKPPAYIKQLSYNQMDILISTKVTERREELNLLVHELGHIYVWRLDPLVFGKCDQEKLVDCSGVFLGLGIVTLNGLTDEYILLGDEGYKTQKKLFGYLEPEQLGYLLACYCAEHNIPENSIKPFLNSTGRKYFNIGCSYLKRSGRIIRTSARIDTGIYWCPKCGLSTRIPLSEKIKIVKCPRCKD